MKFNLVLLFFLTIFFRFSLVAQVATNNTSTSGGTDATAIGRESISSAEGTTAIGINCEATGNNATAIGYKCIAGISSTALGMESQADHVSTAFGLQSIAKGNYSTAIGIFANAKANFSTAFGFNATAQGIQSHAYGSHVKSQSFNSIALGSYNLDTGDSLKWVPTDPILTVGIGTQNSPANALAILKNGLVLVGTSINSLNANAIENTKLAVNGNIYAAGMRVRLPTNGSFPDYVFEKGYDLKPLSAVESYIKEHKHLEGIPSATETEMTGMDMVQMDIKLLEKVEELTLYLIQLKKENDQMKQEILKLKQKNLQ